MLTGEEKYLTVMNQENSMEDKMKVPGRRLIQLAINDAIQSRLSLVSPFKSLMEKEKREKRKNNCKFNKITLSTENTCQNSHIAQDMLPHEGMKGVRNCAHELKRNYHSNESLNNVKNQSKYLPSSKHTFHDRSQNEFSSQWMENNYNPSFPVFSSKSRNWNPLQSSTPSSTNSDVTPASSEFKCTWRKSYSTSSDCESSTSSIDALAHRTLLNSHSPPICPSYNCDVKSAKSITELNSTYDLPILSPSCESTETSKSNHNNNRAFFKPCAEDDYISKIPKMSFDPLPHMALHSPEGSLRSSSKESLYVNDFIPPPFVTSRRLDVDEQNFLDNYEIKAPVPYDTIGQMYSSRLDAILPDQEDCDRMSENLTDNEKITTDRSSSLANKDIDFFQDNSILKQSVLNSDPNFSTFKHFEGLIFDSDKCSPLMTVTTDDPELKLLSNHLQLDNCDIECPISKPHAKTMETSGFDCISKRNIGRHDYLLDSFLNLNLSPIRDETPVMSSNFTNMNVLNDTISFDNNLYSRKSNNTCSEMYGDISNQSFGSNCEKSNLEKWTESSCMESSNLLQHFPDFKSSLKQGL